MITLATVDDLQELSEAAQYFLNTSKKLGPYDPAKFIALWTGLITSGVGVIFIQICKTEIVGALAGVKYPDQYSDRLIASEFFWYVKPENRGGGIELLHVFAEWANKEGCSDLRMGFLADVMPDKVERLYQRLGFEKLETVYTKRIV